MSYVSTKGVVFAQGVGICMSANYTFNHFSQKYGENSISYLQSGSSELIIMVNTITQSWTIFYVNGSYLCPLFFGKGIKGPLLTKLTPI